MNAPSVEIIVEAGEWPPQEALRDISRRAVEAAFEAVGEGASSHPSPIPSPLLRQVQDEGGGEPPELCIVFTDDAAMRKLNARWRDKDMATNVLSFPQAGPQNSGALLGDVILSAETVAREAALAEKPLVDHMAHLLIHGYLHLLGFDHEAEADAEKMEQLERVALKKLGMDGPYATPQDDERRPRSKSRRPADRKRGPAT